MSVSYFRVLIHKLLKKDSDIVPKEALPTIFDSKSSLCMTNQGSDTKHTSHIARRVYFVKNCENCKIHQIE